MLNRRTLTVHSEAIPQVGGQPALEPVRLSGREGLNGLFCYELILKTPDALSLDAHSAARLASSGGGANWDLNHFLGREISCAIALDGQGRFAPGAVGSSVDHIGQGERQINALITEAQLWGEEGRHVQYKLTLRPWLHLATLSADCKIFQNQSAVQTLDALLADYPFPVDKRLSSSSQSGPSGQSSSADAVRDYQCQFNETDHQFFERLCQAHGISYFFEHSQGKHRLVLVDSMGAYQKSPSAAYQSVEYHPPGSQLDAEYISRFVPHHQLTSGQYTSRDYDYSRPRADLTASAQDARPASLGIAQSAAEVYQWHGAQGGSHYAQPGAGSEAGNAAGGAPGSATGEEANDLNDPHAQGRHFALLRLQALRSPGVRAQASGNLRGMVPGCSFALQKHPQHGANTDWLVLDSHLRIEDIDQASQASQC